jgi:hypothetical protein
MYLRTRILLRGRRLEMGLVGGVNVRGGQGERETYRNGPSRC